MKINFTACFISLCISSAIATWASEFAGMILGVIGLFGLIVLGIFTEL